MRIEYAVYLDKVVKDFGKVRALDGLSLRVRPGTVFGLIGPNGAGKTTTLRIISTLVTPDSGKVYILGRKLPEEKDHVRPQITYLPEDAGIYHRLTGWENLLFYAMIYYGKTPEAEEVAKYGAQIASLPEKDLNRKASEYSKGMIRRIAIARTLMLSPQLAILDEPTSGLDIFSAYRVRKMIKGFVKETGSTIILSSHNMLEIEDLCDEVALIHKGKIVAEGMPQELLRRYGGRNLEEVFIALAGGGE